MTAYYNEIDPYAAQWLRNLIAAGHIAAGDVDERSIVNVQPDDLRGYAQCHFFAGIGGWSLALRLAGWSDDRPVWTGSCPCQPFSAAGKQAGTADERHLWPAWYRLIDACRPPVIFGEQVASAAVVGLARAKAALCDGEPEEEQGLRTDSTCAGPSKEEGISFRSRQLFDRDSATNRQRLVRGDGIASQFGGWPNMGQSFAGPDRFKGAVSLLEHSNCLPWHQQCHGGLGRAAHDPDGSSDSCNTKEKIERLVDAYSNKFGPTTEWAWIDLIHHDLERADYAIGAAVLPACSVGAPHIRQRLWFVADRTHDGRREERANAGRRDARNGAQGLPSGLEPSGDVGGMANAGHEQARGSAAPREAEGGRSFRDATGCDVAGGLADADGGNASAEGIQRSGQHGFQPQDGRAGSPVVHATGEQVGIPGRAREPRSAVDGMGDTGSAGLQERKRDGGVQRETMGSYEGQAVVGRSDPWHPCDWIPCTDGKARPVAPGSFPLGHGVHARASKLRAYGNAIVPQVAAAFIECSMNLLTQRGR